MISFVDLSVLNSPPGCWLMAVLKAYFDDSGDENDYRVLSSSLAGYVGTIDNWRYFEAAWQKTLQDHNIPYLHMKQFAHFRKPFDKYKNDEVGRIALLESLINVIKDSHLEGVASCVDLRDLRSFNDNIKKADREDAYALNLYTCMWIMSKRWPKTIIETILDRTNNIYAKIQKAIVYAQADKHYKDYEYIQINPLNRHLSFRNVIPIQAADLLAWEMRKDDTTATERLGDIRIYPKFTFHPIRKSFESLLTSTFMNPTVLWSMLILLMRKEGGYLAILNEEENMISMVKDLI
jgi:hypothetical protein